MTSPSKPDLVVAGTGHRPAQLFPHAKNPYDPQLLGGFTAHLASLLKRLRPTRVITGMALGFDTALAIAALHERIPFTAAIPFLGQESRWPLESRKRYLWLLSEAESVQQVEKPGYAAWKMQSRNRWMVDHCHLLLTGMYSHTSSGGTWNCVEYARSKPVVILHAIPLIAKGIRP